MVARAAVLGRPIGHSLSPVLHGAAYSALALDWSYEAIDCGADQIAAVLAARADWAGFSCTMPLKRVALDLADEVRPLAARVGAANTLLPRPAGGWIADNTDVSGVVAALAGRADGCANVAVLGAGGTAQAVLAALAQVGVAACTMLVRDRSRAAAVARTAAAVGVELTLAALGPQAPGLSAELVVSTLPRGVGDALAAHSWRRGQVLLDVVYDPWPTALAAAAGAAGAVVLSGALMLLYQAAAQVELMTGRAAPVEAMRAALRTVAPNSGI